MGKPVGGGGPSNPTLLSTRPTLRDLAQPQQFVWIEVYEWLSALFFHVRPHPIGRDRQSTAWQGQTLWPIRHAISKKAPAEADALPVRFDPGPLTANPDVAA